MALLSMGRDPETLTDFVHEAKDGTEAVSMFKAQFENENPYTLVFMDCSMEPMDGYTATKLIKQFCTES